MVEAERADPAQVCVEWTDRPAAEHDAGIRGIVGDGVVDFSGRFGLGIDAFDPRVQNLQRRDDEVGGLSTSNIVEWELRAACS